MARKPSIELVQFAKAAAAVVGIAPDRMDEVLKGEGLTRKQFERASVEWGELLVPDNEPLVIEYYDLLVEALTARIGEGPPLSFDEFVESVVALNRGPDLSSFYSSPERNEAWLFLRSMEWRKRLFEDHRLAAIFALRVRLAFREDRPAPELPSPKLARLVLPRTCPRCGGSKRTEPRTAYVYCDYCAYLFDYAWEKAGPSTQIPVFDSLMEAVADQLQAQREAGDWDAYRSTWRWIYDSDMELCPEGWSPRIAQASYRQAMLDFSVETCVLRNTRPELRGKNKRVEAAYLHAAEAPSRQRLLDYFRALLGEVDREIHVYTETGLWARHPDQLDASTYRHIASVQHLRDVLTNADEVARQSLLKEAGLDRPYLELPEVETDPCTCGCCGGPLLVVEGAKCLLCEACGMVLDARSRRMRCTSCGAGMLVTSSKPVACCYCRTVFVPSA